MRPRSETPYDGDAGFRDGLLRLLCETRHQLLWVDRDFSGWGLERPAFAALLHERLVAGVSLRMVIDDESWLAGNAPRWSRLRRRLGDRVQVRLRPEALRSDAALACSDRQHLLERAHPRARRSTLVLASPEGLEPVLHRLEALWDASSQCLPGTTLGL